MPGGLPIQRERRKEPRHRVRFPVVLQRGSGRAPGVCLDLSYQGMLVEMDKAPDCKEGELLRVEVAHPDEPVEIVTAVVTRVVERKLGLLIFGMSGEPAKRWYELATRIIKRGTPTP